MARRLLILLVVVGLPFMLFALGTDDWESFWVVSAMGALLFGVPAYFIVAGGPNAWRRRVTELAAPLAGEGTFVERYESAGLGALPLEGFDRLGLLPGYGGGHFDHFITGTANGTRVDAGDLRLRQGASSEGSGARLLFHGLVMRLELPMSLPFNAHIGPGKGRLARWLKGVPGDFERLSVTAAGEGRDLGAYTDSPGAAAGTITAEVLAVLGQLGEEEGRGVDPTTIFSIVAGLLTGAGGAKAVTAGTDGQYFYVAVDRRKPFFHVPHPLAAPREADALLARFRRDIERVGRHVEALKATPLFRS